MAGSELRAAGAARMRPNVEIPGKENGVGCVGGSTATTVVEVVETVAVVVVVVDEAETAGPAVAA